MPDTVSRDPNGGCATRAAFPNTTRVCFGREHLRQLLSPMHVVLLAASATVVLRGTAGDRITHPEQLSSEVQRRRSLALPSPQLVIGPSSEYLADWDSILRFEIKVFRSQLGHCVSFESNSRCQQLSQVVRIPKLQRSPNEREKREREKRQKRDV